MIKLVRKNTRNGTSHYVALPSQLDRGDFSTLAAQRLVLIDPLGKISSEMLSKLLEELEAGIYRKR